MVEEEQDEQSQPEHSGRNLDARLEQLERAFGEQSARMRRIEQHLGIVATPSPDDATTAARAFGQGRAVVPAATPPPEEIAPPTAPPRGMWADGDVPAAEDKKVADELSSARAQSPPQTSRAGAVDASSAASEPQRPPTAPPHVDDEEQARGDAPGRTAAATGARSWVDLETSIGGSWFNWIGIVALTLGVGFFLKYAFENQWIGPTGRVLLGGAGGCALLGLAERLRLRGYRSYAAVLSGGGILILYLSAYAAYNFYHLIGQLPAFLLMAVVTAAAVLLAARYDALPIAILGLLGGFMTPVLLSRGVDNQIALFGYIALLDAGVLALAYFKEWRSLNYLSFAATVLMFAGWLAVWYEPETKLWPTLFFLTLFFVMFAALAILHNVLRRRPARWFDVSLVIANATLYFGASYELLNSYLTYYPNFAGRLAGVSHLVLGAHALAVAAFFVILFLIAESRHREDQLLSLSYVGAAVTFLTIAVAIIIDQHWATIGWAVEGLVLSWIGFRTGRAAPRYAALLVMAVAVGHWYTTDALEFLLREVKSFWPLVNAHAVSCYALIAAVGLSLWLYARGGEQLERSEREILRSVFVLVIFTLGLTLLTIDVSEGFNQRRAMFDPAADQTVRESFAETQRFTTATLWLLYATVGLALGVVLRVAVLRIASLLILFCAVLTSAANGSDFYSAAWHLPLFNLTFAGFVLSVAALASGAYFYRRAPEESVGAWERNIMLPALVGTANLFALAGLSLEVMGYFNRAKALAWAQPESWLAAARVENWKQLTLSLLWTIYGTVAFVVGLRRRSDFLRFGALGLLALTGVKILLVDATYYNAAWHVPIFNQTFAAFAIYLLALAVVARLSARDSRIDAGERQIVMTVITVAGNVLAIIALSLEAAGHFEKLMRLGAAAGERRDLRLARQLSLSIIWALYGGALLVVGLVRRQQLLRVMALILLSLTILKVFFWDLSSLDKIYRIISFIVLGAILLVVSFLYQQRQQRAARAEGP
ncbi:MAG: DUF2339 domain-containing protein [Acidobacteriota bacterium]|nr:DUF2339 domain-containing protein [Acidobacteriota bacterium]